LNSYLILLSGLLLPWLVGTLWLALVEGRLIRDSSPNRLRQVGYGFFLGYGVLFLTVLASDAWVGTVNWAWIMIILGLLAMAAAAMLRMRGRAPARPAPVDSEPLSVAHKVLLTALISWIGLHIALAGIENISQPLYPWDAWTTWVYRASLR